MAMILRIDIAKQCMALIEASTEIESFPISTSQFGTGSQEGSFQTPLGHFRICEKIGEGAPLGAVFRARVWTGEIWVGESSESIESSLDGQSSNHSEDAILTRILRLDGCEASNFNTLARYIYIHGTNQESRIGTPSSHGCIRMRNADIIRLYDLVSLDTAVEIF